MFEVGDRVRIIDTDYFDDLEGHIGIIGYIYKASGNDWHVSRSKKNSGLNDYLGLYKNSSLKLIEKGKDMEIKIGQVWESLYRHSSGEQKKILGVYKEFIGGDKHYDRVKMVDIKSGKIEYDPVDAFIEKKNYKLISEGEQKKMEKKKTVKGVNLKKGMWITDSSDLGETGKIIASKGFQYLCETQDGSWIIIEYPHATIMKNSPKQDIVMDKPKKRK